MRNWVIWGVSWWALAGLGWTGSLRAESITFMLDWVPNGRHTAFVAGKAKGFYKEAGLEVVLPRGFGGPDSIKKVAGGNAEFSLAEVPQMVMARAQNVPIKILGFLHDRGQIAIFALEGSGIQAPKDLEGRTAGDAPTGHIVFFPAFAKLHGIRKWNVTHMTPDAKLKALVAGQVEFIVGFTTQQPTLVAMGKSVGKRIVHMPFSEYGLDLYGTGFFTTEARIAKEPDLVRRFTRATVKSIDWALKNSEEAVRLFVKAHPATTPKIVGEQWDIVVDHMKTDRFRKMGLGWTDEAKMARTVETVTTLMNLPRKVSAQEMYTNAFLPKVLPQF
ncbi:MAG: ABC transporter substrate-binding protein [Candidatus Tectomicrobia bacterium]|nr:ABC transporter substrate-binding protein [Candidatus Tectomicrobia bacterium]